MKATYQHCTMFGSHNVPCKIIDSRPWTEEYMTSIERDFGKRTVTEKQYLIQFFDSFEYKVAEKWVNDCYVKVGKK